MSVAKVYPLYVTKVERKGRTEAELLTVICWLTGYSEEQLRAQLEQNATFEAFFASAPQLNPHRDLITGVICGVRIQEITEPLMREIRYMDKLVDELAKGRAMEKILRKPEEKEAVSPWPKGVGSPAVRALTGAGFTQLSDLTRVSKKELSELHGMGPKALRVLEEALQKAGIAFAATV
jgi:hypothetical protein